MCICENAAKAKIPEGKAGIIKNQYAFFFAFHIKGKRQDETAVPIAYCPYCGKNLRARKE